MGNSSKSRIISYSDNMDGNIIITMENIENNKHAILTELSIFLTQLNNTNIIWNDASKFDNTNYKLYVCTIQKYNIVITIYNLHTNNPKYLFRVIYIPSMLMRKRIRWQLNIYLYQITNITIKSILQRFITPYGYIEKTIINSSPVQSTGRSYQQLIKN
jgi:hypothetical protein